MNIITKSTRPLSNEERLEIWEKSGEEEVEYRLSGWEIFCKICTGLLWFIIIIVSLFLVGAIQMARQEPETRTFHVPIDNSYYSRTQRVWELDDDDASSP